MISTDDSIRYQNVVSKRYHFFYTDMTKYMQEFLEEIKRRGLHPHGKIFYTLNNVPKDENMDVEFFLPVREENVESQGEFHYHSYYEVENMISTRVVGDFEQNTQVAYSALNSFMTTMNLKQITPPFHVIDRAGETDFVTIKIGYSRLEKVEEE